MTSYAIGRALERNIVEELIHEPEWTGSQRRGNKVDVDGTNFVIQSKNWRKSIFPGVVMGCLFGVIVAPEMNRHTTGTKETARTSPFTISLTTRANLIRDLK
ncbi:16682_t:CDS:2 [Funneliformis geosporum]|nr:16682_t:CDS:2 [Funneliformis geosporum]